MKAGESWPDQGRDARLSCPGSTVPSPKIAAVERREAMRFPVAREARQHICALRRSMPLMVGGAKLKAQLAHGARTIMRGCLKIESGI